MKKTTPASSISYSQPPITEPHPDPFARLLDIAYRIRNSKGHPNRPNVRDFPKLLLPFRNEIPRLLKRCYAAADNAPSLPFFIVQGWLREFGECLNSLLNLDEPFPWVLPSPTCELLRTLNVDLFRIEQLKTLIESQNANPIRLLLFDAQRYWEVLGRTREDMDDQDLRERRKKIHIEGGFETPGRIGMLASRWIRDPIFAIYYKRSLQELTVRGLVNPFHAKLGELMNAKGSLIEACLETQPWETLQFERDWVKNIEQKRDHFLDAWHDVKDNILPCVEIPQDGPREPNPTGVPGASEGDTPPADPKNGPPEWITKHFRSKQYSVLMFLWGKGNVLETDICEHLAYTAENLKRRITDTNKNLCERSKEIGDYWTIREMTREGVRYRYLERQK